MTFKHKAEYLTIRVLGKWILAGEYTVLKSGPALAFPLPSHFMEMRLTRKRAEKPSIKAEHLLPVATVIAHTKKAVADDKKSTNKLERVTNQKDSSALLKKTFVGLLGLALQKAKKNFKDLNFDIHIQSHISFGAGMGASAVLCVLVGRLFQGQGWLKEKELFDFCHELENHLHGQSSGLDIAVVLKQQPVLFAWAQGGFQQIKTFQPVWKPNVFLSYAGEGRTTKQNIRKIKTFWKSQPEKAKTLDQQMKRAVAHARESLVTGLEDKKLGQLKKSFALAEKCFLGWDLVGPAMQKHMHFLKEQGALAVKPTGSGSGGYVLSLWPGAPPSHLRPLLIPTFTHKE